MKFQSWGFKKVKFNVSSVLRQAKTSFDWSVTLKGKPRAQMEIFWKSKLNFLVSKVVEEFVCIYMDSSTSVSRQTLPDVIP